MRELIIMRKIAAVCAFVAIGSLCGRLCALPPLGITHVGELSGGNLEIIGEAAYIGADGSVSRVDSEGTVSLTELMHPELGTPSDVTRVVKADDGELYVGANFGELSPFVVGTSSAMYRLAQPNSPVVTWQTSFAETVERPWIVGIDQNLRGVGYLVLDPEVFATSAAEFNLDGSIEYLERPEGADPTYVGHVSPGGYAFGSFHIPGTAGSGAALWSPTGTFSYVSGGTADSMRDRLDGQGVNFGANFGILMIQYGEQPLLEIDASGDRVIVSHSDFALVEDPRPTPLADDYLVFFPGIVPDDPTQAVPLFDVFPELASVNFDRITDLAAVDGRIYMTLAGEDGLYLFGARDPSLIPEPATVVLALLLAGGVLACRRSMFRRNADASAVC